MVLNNARFQDPLISCDVVLGAGSCMLVAPLVGCNSEPTVYTVTNAAAVALNATTISLSVTTPATLAALPVYKGKVIYFGAVPIVFAKDGVITNTAASFEIEPASATVALNATADTFPLYPILSTSDMPLSFNDTTQDTTDHKSGLQGAMVKTNYEITTQVSGRVRCDDAGLNKVLFPAQKTNGKIYVVYSIGDVAGCGTLAWGTAIVSNYAETNATKDFVKWSLNLLWQPPTAIVKLRSDLTTAQQTEFDLAVKYLGLPIRA